MEFPFDVLMRIDVVNFEWLEVVRDLQSGEARVHELQALARRLRRLSPTHPTDCHQFQFTDGRHLKDLNALA